MKLAGSPYRHPARREVVVSKRLDPDVRSDAVLATAFGIVSSGLPIALAQRFGLRVDAVAGQGVLQAFGCGVAAVFAILIARRPRFELSFDRDERTLAVRSLGLRTRSVMVSRIEPQSQVFRESDGDGVYLLSVDDDGVERRVTPRLPVEHFESLVFFRTLINETSLEELGSSAPSEATGRWAILGRTLTSARFWWCASAALIMGASVNVLRALRF